MSDGRQRPPCDPPEQPITARQTLLACGSLLAVVAALAAPLIFAGFRSVWLLAAGVVGFGVVVAGLWWALSHTGASRTAGLVTSVVALLIVAIVYIHANFIWVIALSVALWLFAGFAARTALRGPDPNIREYETPPPRRAFIIMNPRSGGGKVARFGLVEKAEALGAHVVLLGDPEQVDLVAMARAAVADGADLLGVAGGDGTQALVAGVAAEHGTPLLVISVGTRNHFALDLGLDRDDPARCLDAVTDGVELHVDLGTVNGRPFVNNASFGAYAEVVQSPEYRDAKTGTILRMLPDLLVGHIGARLEAQAADVRVEAPQAVLVSNNPYGTGDPAGMGRRARLDLGLLGFIGVRVDNALQAASLLRGRASAGVTTATAAEVTVTADAPEIPVGVDGEALMMRTPVVCAIRPGVLRVRVPRNRPGRAARPPLNWHNVRSLVVRLTHRAGHASPAPTSPAEAERERPLDEQAR